MTCARRESALSLHVEGDLPEAEALALEAHLQECAACRAFLDELRESQRALHDLSSEPLDPQTLESLARRIASVRSRSPGPSKAWGWAIAASLAAAAAGYWLWPGASHDPGPSRRVAAPTPPAPQPSLVQEARPPERVVHAAPSARPLRRAPRAEVPRLSSDDLDQLARAVAVVSRIESVDEALREPPPADPSPASLARLATSDPDIVIYWRLDSNGGE
jgi:anti-sigma factor RsiW